MFTIAPTTAPLQQEKLELERKRNVMVLILKHLHDEGCVALEPRYSNVAH